MFARMAVAMLLGSSVLTSAQAAAQPNRPPSNAPPHAPPHFSPPPHMSPPPHFSPPPRMSPPPHFSPRTAPPPHVGSPQRFAPLRFNAPPHTPPHVPSVTMNGGHPRMPDAGRTSGLNHTQTRQLRLEENTQLRQLQAQQRQRLHDLRAQGHPDVNTLRQLRSQNAQQVRDLRLQFRDRRLGLPIGGLRPDGRPRMTPESVRQGRFASRFLHQAHPGRWRADHVRAELAWRRHHRAGFVPWRGPLFYPDAYTDLFYYPFWPGAYDDAYWPYVYDDFLDSVYWATGNPYSEYSYSAPTAASVAGNSGASRNLRQAGDICGSGGGITAWPFAKIESVVKPTAEQQALLDELKAAAAHAADALKASCPQAAALTPTGRLDAMIVRLQAASDAVHAVHAVHGPLMKFYDSLSDEQKARFNSIGPNAGPNAGTNPSPATSTVGGADANICSGQKQGLTDLPVERIEDTVRPTDGQQAKLDELGKANERAVAILQAACPDVIPQTPVGRLDAIEKRLDAMIQAARAIQPALQDFYGSLTDEQKSRFNMLGQQTAG